MKNNLHVLIILFLLFSPVLYDIFRLIYRIRVGEIPFSRLKKYLIRIFSVSILLLCVILALNNTNYLNYESPIPYSEIDRISFQNFRGLEFFRKELNGNERFAYVVTSIEHEIGSDEVYIEAFFHPSRSFVYNRNSYSNELLRHELYHFKVTELFARKIKKEISKLDNPDHQDINSIIEKNLNEEKQFQRNYDSDTYHSFILKEQKKYENQIDSLINSLKRFQNPIIVLDEKN